MAPACIMATTIELKTGNGAVGTMDPLIDFSTNWGTTFQDAYIITADPAYQTIPGTQWISFSADGRGGTEFSSNFLFRAAFELPTGFSSPSLSIQVHADNSAVVYLNGHKIGEQPFDEMGLAENFWDPAETFQTNNPALFVSGQNILDIRVYDGLSPMGLDYLATVSFIPEPAPAVFFGMGAVLATAIIGSATRRSRR